MTEKEIENKIKEIEKLVQRIERIEQNILELHKLRVMLPPYSPQMPYNQPFSNTPLHYHGGGIPCWNNPCIWG